jgi:endonuclease/exonuclease/phosphatase family metal-dependent hydrolase
MDIMPTRRHYSVFAALAALLVALVLATHSHVTYPQTYLQLNMCGNACNKGSLTVVTAVERSIDSRQPFVVTLNETCENQFNRFKADLVVYRAFFDPTGPTCHNGTRYGNIILVRATNTSLIGRWTLPNPADDETRGLMCVYTQLPQARPLAACVTHISDFPGNIASQVRTVASVLSGLRGLDAVLIGGDFNTDPGDARMDPMYDPCYGGGAGVFVESDSFGCASRYTLNQHVGGDTLNQATLGNAKFDNVFLSRGDWSSASATVADAAGGLSDHRGLWATAVLGPGDAVRP